MKRSWAWPVLMAIVLPGGVLLAAAWLLARSRQAPPNAGEVGAAVGPLAASRWMGAGPAARWPWPASSSRRWEWPTARGTRPSAVRSDTLH